LAGVFEEDDDEDEEDGRLGELGGAGLSHSARLSEDRPGEAERALAGVECGGDLEGMSRETRGLWRAFLAMREVRLAHTHARLGLPARPRPAGNANANAATAAAAAGALEAHSGEPLPRPPFLWPALAVCPW
jgi:hypothetical protein